MSPVDVIGLDTARCLRPGGTDAELSSDRPAADAAEYAAPVRVLHVVPALSLGGMERAMLRLIRHSNDQDDGANTCRRLVHAVCALRAEDDDMLAECRSAARTWVLDERDPGSRWRRYLAWRRLRKVIWSFRPDIVHARSTGTWFDAAAATFIGRRASLLLSFHGRTDLSRPGWRRRALNRWATRRADAVLALCGDAARMMQVEWHVPAAKIHVLPNGVDTRRFRPAAGINEILQARRRLDLHPEDHVVICVANLVPIKGLDVLLRAWRQVSMADRRARLLIAGEGPLRHQLEQLTLGLRCGTVVRFLGRVSDVEKVLRAADVFVLPSRSESSSNATLEAMASGLPVVACDVDGMRELVAPNHTGWLVPADAPERLAETLLAVLLDQPARQRVGQAAREAVIRQHRIDTWVAQYVALYRALSGEWRGERTPARRTEVAPCAG